MEWAVRLLFKLVLLVVAVAIVFSFVRQLFSPVERPVVLAGPGGGRLPAPLPRRQSSPPHLAWPQQTRHPRRHLSVIPTTDRRSILPQPPYHPSILASRSWKRYMIRSCIVSWKQRPREIA